MGDLADVLLPVSNDYSLITGSGIVFKGANRVKQFSFYAPTNDTIFIVYLNSDGKSNKLVTIPVKAGYHEQFKIAGSLKSDFGCYVSSSETDGEITAVYCSIPDNKDFE